MATSGEPEAEQPAPEDLRRRLDGLRAARGFLLPHHGAMAAAMPDLHDAYLQMYKALTLVDRHLSPLEKESVWLAILVTTGESIGTHHLELFVEAGGDTDMAASLLSMAGFAHAWDALDFAGTHWGEYLLGLDPAAQYKSGLEALRVAHLPAETVELAMLAVQSARGNERGMAHHIRRCYELGVAEKRMVEALGYLMWPCGVNSFLEACTVWHGLMRDGIVKPSPLFQVWADTAGLGAYNRSGDGGRPGGFDAGGTP